MPSIFELTPHLLGMNGARVDSVVSSNAEAYAADTAFFAANPKRKTHLRHDKPGEFDLEMPLTEWLQIPRLWNLVVRIAPGVHLCVPIYRGKACWSGELQDDDAVSIALIEMGRRQGIDLDEWAGLRKRVNAKNTKYVTQFNRPTNAVN